MMTGIPIRKILKVCAAVLGVAAVATAVFLINLVWFRPWSLNLYYEKIFVRFALQNPELLTSFGLLEKFGYRSHNGHLDDVSIAHTQAMQALYREGLRDLRAYDLAGQTPSQRMSTRILTWYLENEIEGEKFAFHGYPVNQFIYSVQNATPEFMIETHRISDRTGAEHYLARLGEWGRKFDQVIVGLQYREERGISPPRFVVQRVLMEMRGFIGKPTRENILYTSFAKRVEALKSLSDPDKAALKARCEAALTATVYPAYNRLIDYCAALEPRTTTDDGVWKLPDGDAFYAHTLRTSTTTRLSPQEVHDLGLREVARIEKEMRTILDALGHTGGTPIEWIKKFPKNARSARYANTEEGRAAVLADYSSMLDQSFERSKQFFGLMPKARLEVRRVPEFKEAGSPPAYCVPPALDGSRPGVFYANLRNVAGESGHGMKTLAYHEGIPGHHFQFAIARELKGLPTFRGIVPFDAYGEGWALYAEGLAVEMGLYQDDPYGNFMRLWSELFRADRLVVDTGIHYKRWTRDEAIRYTRDKSGISVDEIERYIVWPGQACSYMVGMLKFRELRARAEQQLGPKFVLKEFHDTVLRNGAVPLDILEELVGEWIAAKQARAL